MDWKFLLGLELDDPGFEASVLSLFRSRLIEHGLEQTTLELVLERLRGLDLLKAGGRQRTDLVRGAWGLAPEGEVADRRALGHLSPSSEMSGSSVQSAGSSWVSGVPTV